ncbi:hypothetical protein OG543_12255 [Streptomyces sp. NBC_01178]|uniref:hypothetical protein n=1 Tax=Streptomyces sp. NBC_01178 TaxID=2903762 RepID=UPI003870D994|nr:hypothetical protein OG543_12255 [Streptomyces sp. NBC_01178]
MARHRTYARPGLSPGALTRGRAPAWSRPTRSGPLEPVGLLDGEAGAVPDERVLVGADGGGQGRGDDLLARGGEAGAARFAA